MNIQHYSSPVGEMIIGATATELVMADWATESRRATVGRRVLDFLGEGKEDTPNDLTYHAIEQLDEYFACRRTEFTLPLLLCGTLLQCRVWEELMKIPYGHTVSYRDIAVRIGLPKAVRAVATAIGQNAMSIIIPCHRVIGTNGKLTGYAGGIDAKRTLLQLENDNCATNFI